MKKVMKIVIWSGLTVINLMILRELYVLFWINRRYAYPLELQTVCVVLSTILYAIVGNGLCGSLFKRFKQIDWIWLLFWVVITNGITIVYRHLHLLWFHTPLSANDYGHIQTGVYLRTQPMVLLAFVCYIVLLAPLVEEILFRGLFDKWVMGKRFMPIGLMISSIFFSLIHAQTNWLTFSFYTVLGACFFVAYKRRGSVGDAIIVHSLYNVITMIYLGFTYVL